MEATAKCPPASCVPGSDISAALGAQSGKMVMKEQCHVPIPFPGLILTLPHSITASFPQWEHSGSNPPSILGSFRDILINL